MIIIKNFVDELKRRVKRAHDRSIESTQSEQQGKNGVF